MLGWEERFGTALLGWSLRSPQQSQRESFETTGSRQVGTRWCTSDTTVLSVTTEGRRLLIYLFHFYYVMLATFLRQFFFFYGKP